MAFQDQFFSHNQNRNLQSFTMNNNGYDSIQIQRNNLVHSHGIAFQLEKQRQEIDQFIISQRERLKSEINRQSRQNITLILREYEARAIFMTNQKDEEIAKGKRKETELEDLLRKMVMENEAWRVSALQKEAMAVSLNNSIAELQRENNKNNNNNNGGCDFGFEIEDSESRIEEEEEDDNGFMMGNGMMICRRCGLSSSCVVFLPCRHLCSCESCEPLMSSCPVCNMAKKSCLHALF
ncbi:BOI-related E3 ubiquitin-protein ligase 1-like [Impatiens glandulifera]|uniref:BOI-related E3 ubiquitin-protein ligase 1-like n=1 Tax=Impatiens glandulifera TaxID=253017 RepID=UPI001FB10401|nr:BOI-related E3 ubiquitin-protein ligase 1-like [Impatiens glandulifera]